MSVANISPSVEHFSSRLIPNVGTITGLSVRSAPQPSLTVPFQANKCNGVVSFLIPQLSVTAYSAGSPTLWTTETALPEHLRPVSLTTFQIALALGGAPTTATVFYVNVYPDGFLYFTSDPYQIAGVALPANSNICQDVCITWLAYIYA